MPVSPIVSQHCKRQLRERAYNEISQAVRQRIKSPTIVSHPIDRALMSANQTAQATLLSEQDGIFCGRHWAEAVFNAFDPSLTVTWQVDDAVAITAGQILATVSGPISAILAAESTALWFLQRLCGVASAFAQTLNAVAGADLRVLIGINDTPGLTASLKYAMLCADTAFQRVDVNDPIPVTANHIIACGSLTAAMENARWLDPDRPVEVAVSTLQQFHQAQQAGADLILLQGFSLPQLSTLPTALPGLTLVADGPFDSQQFPALAACGIEYLAATTLVSQQPLAIRLSLTPTG